MSIKSWMPRYWRTTKKDWSEIACFAAELVGSNTFERGSCSLDTCHLHPSRYSTSAVEQACTRCRWPGKATQST